VTRGHAVQLATTITHVHFAIRGALSLYDRNGFLLTLSDGHALALGVSQVSILAEATRDATEGATGRMGSVAGGWASAAAFAVHFEFTALFLRRHHHERLYVGLRGAGLLGHAFSIFTIPQVSVLASASGHADTRAQRVRIVASAVASAALTEFLVLVLAHARLHRNDGLNGGGVALFFRHALALFVPQVSFQTEAADDAVLRAHRTVFRMGAGRSAGRAAREEFLLLRTSRELRLELSWDLRLSLSITLGGEHAYALVVLHVAVLAVAAAEASQGAMGRVGTSASRRARGAALTIFGVSIAALRIDRKGGDGQSETDGGKTEQQRESKARVHRLR